MNLDPAIIRHQVETLRALCPELEQDEEAWLLSLESETDMDALLGKIVDRLDDVAALSIGLEAKIAEFDARRVRYIEQQRKLRGIALAVMQMAGISKKELPSATLSVVKGRERLVIPDDTAVPDEYCRFKREPNKTEIKEAIALGLAINWAALETGEQTLSVRPK